MSVTREERKVFDRLWLALDDAKHTPRRQRRNALLAVHERILKLPKSDTKSAMLRQLGYAYDTLD